MQLLFARAVLNAPLSPRTELGNEYMSVFSFTGLIFFFCLFVK